MYMARRIRGGVLETRIQVGIDMDCACYRCGVEFSRKDNLARHLCRKNPCIPIYTPALAMETMESIRPLDTSGMGSPLETRIANLAKCIEGLSMKIDLLVDHVSPGEETAVEEDVPEREAESEGEDENCAQAPESGDEDETIPAPTKRRAMDLCTKCMAKHAKDLHTLADAGPRKRSNILANAPPTLHKALGDVAQLVLDHKIVIPAEHVDEANAHIEDIREFADAPTYGKEQMLQTGSGFLSILGPIRGAIAQPILHALGI